MRAKFHTNSIRTQYRYFKSQTKSTKKLKLTFIGAEPKI